MQSKGRNKREAVQGGFTMIELMVSVVILTIVIGVVVQGLTAVQQRNTIETAKVDLTQESRQFEDQIVSDIHQSGYPSMKMFDPAGLVPPPVPITSTPNCALYQQVSCGLVNVTPSSLQFEADVDGSGTVSEVFIQLNPLNGPCPCIIQRGTVTKAQWIAAPGTLPVYYTEVNNVTNTNIFNGYDNGGNNVALAGVPTNNLASIEITLNVQSTTPDAGRVYPTITMSTAAKIHNFN
ncbi:MAG TPA: type II secretion system protein [Candidatus Acidoferrum sp.]|nr:type II secretion system protein [Candidatus Acidoferrum sp.]